MADPKTPSEDGAKQARTFRERTVDPLVRFWSFLRDQRRWIFLGLLMIPVVAGMEAIRPLLLYT